jgi:2,3,4,5-tetrahydropyridine-2,6-dicarboxylate N-succinyltransferase
MLDFEDLKASIERYAAGIPPGEEGRARDAFEALKDGLQRGEIRAAVRGEDGEWRVNLWVKSGLLLGFRLGKMVSFPAAGPLQFLDKDTYGVRHFTPEQGVRVVPGGSAIREAAYLGSGVICMPPMYVNVGAYVDDGTMIDSHALVGSCAQIGKRVHISAGAQIGGVLEPAGAMPVIIEDDVLVGGNTGVYEGAIVRERAVLAPGTLLTGGTVVVDLVRNQSYRREGDRPLEIPAGAVVVPGTRPVRTGPGKEAGISLYAPIIVKYRDEKTDTSLRLEDLLR